MAGRALALLLKRLSTGSKACPYPLPHFVVGEGRVRVLIRFKYRLRIDWPRDFRPQANALTFAAEAAKKTLVDPIKRRISAYA